MRYYRRRRCGNLGADEYVMLKETVAVHSAAGDRVHVVYELG